MTCECHKVNWMARLQRKDEKYTMIDGSPLKDGVICQDKTNSGDMDDQTYLSVCKYIPGEDGSLFPKEIFYDMLRVEIAYSQSQPKRR